MSASENELSQAEFLWSVRVYYEDTDAGGVVYYTNYLKFMERARTEFLRSLGFEQDQLKQEQGIIFAVHSLSAQYKKPAVFNDELIVNTKITALGRASLTFKQSIARLPDYADLCEAEIKVACLHAEEFSPVAIPQKILDGIGGLVSGS
jgi:acyl-CoA thioester hydrolase